MDAIKNKQAMQEIFSELSKGNNKALINAMSEEMCWNWMGTGHRAKSFVGKPAVVHELLAAAQTTIKQPSKAKVHRILADGDYVVVESTGQNTTTDGKEYNNIYCWVCRFKQGKLREINEYMDTQLVAETFQK